MSAAVLARIEYIKTRRRLAFLVTSLMLTVLVFMTMMSVWHNTRENPKLPPFAFPRAWGQIMGEPAQVSQFFAAVIVVLLVAAEFSWRTARQNVIDGLSKNQWFASKLMLVVSIALLYQVLVLGIGGAFAATNPFTTLMRASDVHMMGGYTLGMLGFVSVGFFLAMTIRNAGPALGVLLLWIALLERIIGMILTKIDRDWHVIAEHFPGQVFQALLEPQNWHPELAREAMRAPQPVAAPPNMTVLCALAGGYIIAFFAISYLSFRNRDL